MNRWPQTGHAARADWTDAVNLPASPHQLVRASSGGLVASALLAAARALDAASPGALRVLLYHRVDRPSTELRGDPHLLSATPEMFDQQMRYVARYYAPVTAGDVVDALRNARPLPRRAVLVTFDDGYRDFLTHAWPVLRRHRVPALLFVPTGYPGSGAAFWWDELYELIMSTAQREVRLDPVGTLLLTTAQERWIAVRILNRYLRPRSADEVAAAMEIMRRSLGPAREGDRLVLTWEELRGLMSEGLAVASHTVAHSSLPTLTLAQCEEELRNADCDLRQHLTRPTPLFSYPYGHRDGRAIPVLRELGYVGAFVSLFGHNPLDARDPYFMRRYAVDVSDTLSAVALSLVAPYQRAYAAARTVKRWRTGGLFGRTPAQQFAGISHPLQGRP